MLKAAAERGWLNEKDAVLEALLCLKRAGSGEGWQRRAWLGWGGSAVAVLLLLGLQIQ